MNYLLRTFTKYQKVDKLDDATVGNRRVGTLGYTMQGLIAVILLICIACSGFIAIQVLVNTMLPKQLHATGASNKTIAFFLTTMPYVIIMIINPVFSFISDRTRKKLGRRIPFLLYTAPIIAICVALLGISHTLGDKLNNILPEFLSGYGNIITLGTLAVAYNAFFMIPNSLFWYLFPDVIPSSFIGRFMSYYNLVASGVSFMVNRFFLKYADTHVELLYSIVAIFFLVSMFIMIFSVKEGSYPPVEDTGEKKGALQSLFNSIKIYCKECYSIKFYYWFFITISLSDISVVCRTMYNIIYAKEVLGIDTASYGEIMAWYNLVGVCLSLPLGYLCDKLNALKVYGFGLMFVVVVNIFSFFLVKNETSFLVATLLLGVVYAIQGVATIPLFVAILPKTLYGQFSSANGLFRAVFIAIAGYGGGVLFDIVKDYQYIYLWDFVFTTAALICFVGLYLSWKSLGGKEHYVAPVAKV